ncbi:alpha/beta hydrolase [Aestuariispira ectoiniformans]|uniref:alpha/beta hydrolase n=1 Tax=Aestuariispira ectoiniformans TaxID=2775080 RepID=UPI00223AF414|nr:alpha/beta hydrolase [Aestuariispira ectoiniformans]
MTKASVFLMMVLIASLVADLAESEFRQAPPRFCNVLGYAPGLSTREKAPVTTSIPKGTYFLGGSGMEGQYIADMVETLKATGIHSAQSVDRKIWSRGPGLDALSAICKRHPLGETAMAMEEFAGENPQFNLIGYSHGGLVAAQIARDYASRQGRIDHLVLIASPISTDFLTELQQMPQIGQVILVTLQDEDDPIFAGMGFTNLLGSLPKLTLQFLSGPFGSKSGHFYLTDPNSTGRKARRLLAEKLYDAGLR